MVNVFAIVNSDILIISHDAFVNIQERLMRQYTHQGRLGAYRRDLTEYEKMIELGKTLGITSIRSDSTTSVSTNNASTVSV